ncbi:MAG: peptide/nickel transport system permease protein [Treponematales bacterium]
MNFILRRLGAAVITLFLVSVMTFAAFRVIPGDAVLLSLGTDATEAQIALLRSEMGLDRSLPAQYFSWLGNFLSGNLGNSFRFAGASVSSLIKERFPVTCCLALFSLALLLLIALPLSLIAGKKENSLADRIINSLTAFSISFPGFFLGVLLIWVFGLTLRWFTPGAYIDYRQNFAGFLVYLFFPALAVALPQSALLVKFLRASIFKEWGSGYVRTAFSKGNPRRRVLYAHILKNAAIPAVTVLGMIAGEVFSGSVIIEMVFSIPGIGRLLITSIVSRDYPVVQTLAVCIAFIVIAANTLADIAIQTIDPRIRIA